MRRSMSYPVVLGRSTAACLVRVVALVQLEFGQFDRCVQIDAESLLVVFALEEVDLLFANSLHNLRDFLVCQILTNFRNVF